MHERLAGIDAQGLLVGSHRRRGFVPAGRKGETRRIVERQRRPGRRLHPHRVGDRPPRRIGVDADGIEQHQPGHAGRAAQRQLGADPAADGIPHQHDIVEVEPLDEREIAEYEVADARKTLGPRLPADAGPAPPCSSRK